MDLLSTVRKSGSRGGVNFSWDEVANSAHRENYLGHSLKAPVGRWQTGRDLSWYAKADVNGANSDETDEQRKTRLRREEIKKIKEAEEDAMAQALGLPPPVRNTSGANAVEVTGSRISGDATPVAGGLQLAQKDAVKAMPPVHTEQRRDEGKDDRRRNRPDREHRHRHRHRHYRDRSRARDRRIEERSPPPRDEAVRSRPRDEATRHRSRSRDQDRRHRRRGDSTSRERHHHRRRSRSTSWDGYRRRSPDRRRSLSPELPRRRARDSEIS